MLPEGDEANIDSAYSTVALPPHTDGNYWEDPIGNTHLYTNIYIYIYIYIYTNIYIYTHTYTHIYNC